MSERPELLAPAGSLEALKAAIAAGADAMYLGAAAHSARASAGFEDRELEEAIHLAHLHQRRVYVTVNTLVKQHELDEVRQLLQKIDALKADAVLVQDLGVLKLIKEEFPDLQVHASTQMSVHNAIGAKMLLSLGVSRVVLAREASLETMKQVFDTGIEVETFVHGALCVSVSGQCQFSSHIGGRSGNRGRCAQPCRLDYGYKGTEGALLSMRDLNTLQQLPQLIKAGVRSFKIEGRLKRPEYVYIVTSIYKKALDRVAEGLPPEDLALDQAALQQIYSRGFTSGHAFFEEDARLTGSRNVSHEGVKMGTLLRIRPREGFVLADFTPEKDLHDADGLQIRGSKDQELIYSGPEVPVGQIATLRLRENAQVNDVVWRLADEQQLAQAREQSLNMPKIPFEVTLQVEPGKQALLTLESRGISVQVSGAVAEKAENRPLDRESAFPSINKTGGTAFVLHSLQVSAKAPSFLSASSLNALRREGLKALEDRLALAMPRPAAQPMKMNKPDFRVSSPLAPKLYALIGPSSDRKALLDAGADQIILAPDDFREGRLKEQLRALEPPDILCLPRQISDKTLQSSLPLIRETGCALMFNNMGHLALPHAQPFITGEGIPVWNGQTIQLLLDAGARAAVLSRELAKEEIAQLQPSALELILPVYGRAELMQLNHCPERVRLGLCNNRAGCLLCDKGRGISGQTLKDRFQCEYPLLGTHFPEGCVIALLHHKALNLSKLAPKMSWLLDLRYEKAADALYICRHYAALLRGEASSLDIAPEPGRFLSGVL